jgi:hypothetical protein
VDAVTCPTEILPEQTCQFAVVFQPVIVGSVSATLSVTADVVGSTPTQAVTEQTTVSGTGASRSGQPPAVDLSSLKLGEVTVGTSASGDVVVLNTTSGAVDVEKVTVAAKHPEKNNFAETGTTCTSDLASGASCLVDISFTPSAPKLRNATLALKVSYTSGSATKTSIYGTSLSGIGVIPTVSLAAPNFGSATIGSSVTNQVLVSNTSPSAVVYHRTVISGPHQPSWSVASTTCVGPVAPGGSCEVELSFAPHTPGDLTTVVTAYLSITVGKHTVRLTADTSVPGTGVQPTFDVAVPGFGPTTKGVGVTGSIAITNTSDVTMSYDTTHFSSGDKGDFSVTGSTCTAELAPSAGCELTVSFDPHQTGSGSRSSIIVVVMIVDGITPTHTVSLGSGISGTES